MNPVALVKVKDSLQKSLQHAIELCGGFDGLKSSVLIKPNICSVSDGTGHSTTDPTLVKNLVKLLVSHDDQLSIKIVESDSREKYLDKAFKNLGYVDLVESLRNDGIDVKLTNLSSSPLKKIDFEGHYFKNPDLPIEIVEEHYFISLAIAKTHSLAYITGALKNQFGLLPQMKQQLYHSQLNEIILDFNEIVKPNLCIIDARVGVEGWDGPETHRLDLLIAGKEPASVDSVMTQVMGLNPEDVPHLVKALKQGMGKLQPDIAGENIEAPHVKFKVPAPIS